MLSVCYITVLCEWNYCWVRLKSGCKIFACYGFLSGVALRSNWRKWLGFCEWESLCFDLLMYKNKWLRGKQWSKVMANNYYQLNLWMASVSFLLTNNAAVNSFFQAGHLDSLTSSEFVGLTRMVEDFVLDCEQICGRQSHSLRATLLTQAKKFVERFHEERKNKLRYCTWCIIRVLWEKL